MEERKLKMPGEMTIHMDPDVKMVLGFMLANIAAPKLVQVANAVKELATPLFSRFVNEPNPHAIKFIPLALHRVELVYEDGLQKQLVSTE